MVALVAGVRVSARSMICHCIGPHVRPHSFPKLSASHARRFSASAASGVFPRLVVLLLARRRLIPRLVLGPAPRRCWPVGRSSRR